MLSAAACVWVAVGSLLAVSHPAFANTGLRLRLATTTSTENSGLTEYLFPDFEARCRCKVDVIAVGTGKALRLGAGGDVDVLLVHDPAREKEFIASGHGTYRREVMYNDFVIVGPSDDPAEVRGDRDAAVALANIARREAAFVSRGDESGTHGKELSLWAAATVTPKGKWYRETGLGMAATLQIADQMKAYALSDRGTFLALGDGLDLEVLVEGDARLLNYYSVIPVRAGERSEKIAELVEEFVAWLTSESVQQRIGNFTVHGQALFHPTPKAERQNGLREQEKLR